MFPNHSQCERRSVPCTYPEHSRRGMRTRKKDKEPESTSTNPDVGGGEAATSSDQIQQIQDSNDSDADPEQLGGEDEDIQDVDMNDPDTSPPPATEHTSPEFVGYSGFQTPFLPRNEIQA